MYDLERRGEAIKFYDIPSGQDHQQLPMTVAEEGKKRDGMKKCLPA